MKLDLYLYVVNLDVTDHPHCITSTASSETEKNFVQNKYLLFLKQVTQMCKSDLLNVFYEASKQ